MSHTEQAVHQSRYSILPALPREIGLPRGKSYLHEFWTNYGWLGTTSLAVIVTYVFDVPNAGIFLMLAIIHSVLAGGWKAGLASATLSTIFTAILLSTPTHLFQYGEIELQKLLAIGAACFATVYLILYMQKRQSDALRDEAKALRAADLSGECDRMFRTMADAAPVLLWMAGPDGARFYFNKPMLAFTGKGLPDLRGGKWHSIVCPQDLPAIANRYSAAIRGMERFEAEYRIQNATGEYRWIQDFGTPRVSADGQYLGYIGCCVDRTERKRVERALHQLSGKLLEMQDEERRRISRELHDTTAQNLAVLSMNLCVVKDAAKDLPDRPRHAVAESLTLAERCSQEIRTLSYLLHPPLLDELGLGSALRAYCTGYKQRTGIDAELKMTDIGRLPGEIETTIFRIVQEALTNVHRHSGSVQVEIRVVRDPTDVRVTIRDFGKGVPPETLEMISEGASPGVGVAGMRERAALMGGILKVTSSDKGTGITAILPLQGQGKH